jgi:hypothetical protein
MKTSLQNVRMCMYVRSRHLFGVFTSNSLVLRFRLPSFNVIEDAKNEIISSKTNSLES